MGFVVNTSSKFVGAGFGRDIRPASEPLPISDTDLEFFIKDGNIKDLSPNKYTINNTGVTKLSSDLNGKDVFQFDGSSYLELANTTDVDLISDFTIHVVAKQDNSSNSYYVMKGDNETANATQYMVNYSSSGDKQVGRVGLGAANTTAEIATADEQAYSVLTLRYKNSDVLEIYADGVLIDSVASPASITSRTEKLTIGAHSTAAKQFKLTGKIASVIIRSTSDVTLMQNDLSYLDDEYDLIDVPVLIDSVIAWYDASDERTITHTAGSVSQFDDKSGNDYHLTQTTGSDQPVTGTRTLNSLNVLDFSSNWHLDLSSKLGLGTNPDVSMIVVISLDSVSSLGKIIQLGTQTRSIAMAEGTSGWSWRFNDGNEAYTTAPIASTPYVISGVRDSGGDYLSSKMFEDGVELTRSSGSNDSGTPDLTDYFIIGAGENSGVGQWFSGIIAEVIVLNSNSASERVLCENYLKSKWGI